MEVRILAAPPVLVERDGRRYVQIIDGDVILCAPIGDGHWFFSQVVGKIVKPALVAYEKQRGV